MKHEGAYRETADQDAAALKKMQKEIAADEKGLTGIQLPEDIKFGDIVPLFEDALNFNKKKEDNPDGIVFYSLATGILKHEQNDVYPYAINKEHYYRYANGPYYLCITLDKNTKKATVTDFSTKETIEELDKIDKNEDQRYLTVAITKIATSIKNINNLKSQIDQNTMKSYLPKLEELQAELNKLIRNLEEKE